MLKREVLRRQRDFDAVYKKGKSAGSRHLVVLCRNNGLGYTRKAFVASKKVGGSVVRSRAVRLMREALRTSGIELESGKDYIFIARQGIETAKMQDVRKSLFSAFRRIGESGKK